VLALNVLEALAARQGTVDDEATEEEPGRILHEIRSGEAVTRDSGWGSVYYGSVDATPLFIMTLAEALRWGADPGRVRNLMPAAEAAAEWMFNFGDADGDGFIEYPGRAVRAGLDNQAWKDSFDAVRHADGTLAEGPIAMVEVQGYAYAALRDLADLREVFGTDDPEPLRRRAAILRDRIHERFWLDDNDCFALALDGDKQPVASVASNAGHLLWTGSVYPELAPRLADRMMEPDMFTGFGLRTLSSRNPGWNPLSYHCGTVWPHDGAIVAAGMFAYGLRESGMRLAMGMLEAAACCNGRLPELFAGFDRSEFDRPVPYPAACSPQAWSAGAPLMLARHIQGLTPQAEWGKGAVHRGGDAT
jgi:glycogen debranching enzyme